MIEGTETAETEALLEAGEDLFERIRRGEDVEADLRAWSKRVDRITGRRLTPAFAKAERPSVRLQIKINVLLRAKGA